MNRDLVEIYNKLTDLKSKLSNVDVNLDFPEIVVVGAQVAGIFNSKLNLKCNLFSPTESHQFWNP